MFRHLRHDGRPTAARSRLILAGLVSGLGALAALLAPAQPGLAAPGSAAALAVTAPVLPQPAAGTPHLVAATATVQQIRQLAVCGGVMYAVGSFSSVQQGGKTYARRNAFSFSASAPFTLTSWNPGVNGPVNAITFNSGHCADAYLGGSFSEVGGKPAANLAEVTTSGSGALVTAFGHAANNAVQTLASYQGHVLAGGFFTTVNGSSADPYFASLNSVTGRNDGLLALRIAGHYSFPKVSGNYTKVENQQISHGGRLDLVEGDFTSVSGHRRHQIFMINLATRPTATLTRWTSPLFDGSRGYPPGGYYYNCSDREPYFVRAAAWSPDDRTIYLATTGFRPWNYHSGLPLRGLCDAASAFPASQGTVYPKWINYTGCDSLYSVAADAFAAYFGGHERWSMNPAGCNTKGPGSYAAPGMEGLAPATGTLLLNTSGTARYTRSRGYGADDMLVTPAGLWIASDNFAGSQTCNGVQGLAGLCFLPYAG